MRMQFSDHSTQVVLCLSIRAGSHCMCVCVCSVLVSLKIRHFLNIGSKSIGTFIVCVRISVIVRGVAFCRQSNTKYHFRANSQTSFIRITENRNILLPISRFSFNRLFQHHKLDFKSYTWAMFAWISICAIQKRIFFCRFKRQISSERAFVLLLDLMARIFGKQFDWLTVRWCDREIPCCQVWTPTSQYPIDLRVEWFTSIKFDAHGTKSSEKSRISNRMHHHRQLFQPNWLANHEKRGVNWHRIHFSIWFCFFFFCEIRPASFRCDFCFCWFSTLMRFLRLRWIQGFIYFDCFFFALSMNLNLLVFFICNE